VTTPPGGLFPTITLRGELLWWVIPEGAIGQITNNFTFAGDASTLYTVKQSTTRPPGAKAGPFTTQAQAQAQADTLNASGRAASVAASPGAVLGNPLNAIGDLAHRLTESQTWIRVGEFIAGGLLLYVGAKAFFPTTVNTLVSTAKGTVKAGKAGLI
jgi:hypothetical protein